VFRHVKAIGFDLFNTLITLESFALDDALNRLTSSLGEHGLDIEHDQFVKVYRQAVWEFLEQTRKDGKEGHNRFWISSALGKLGYNVAPDDPHIAVAVERYFSAFTSYVNLIPATTDMLATLSGRYRLGLLSNFTHPPAAMEIISALELKAFFDVVLISGDLGYRKPHPSVFHTFIDQMAVQKDQIVYIGDDVEADIAGGLAVGLQPIWTTYVRDNDIPVAPGIPSSAGEEPHPAVPRISTWKDLFSLLETT
jgi:putative hydrolase of the HAD superfamily